MPHIGKVFNWFDENYEIFKNLNPKSLLYVGYTRCSKRWWLDKFCVDLGIEKTALVDIFKDNADAASKAFSDRDVTVIHGDVRKIDTFSSEGEFDVIFWDHGPEHCDEEDLDSATELLKKFAGKCLIYCCPWGNWPQGVLYGNEWERHRTEVVPEMFERNGLTVVTFGTIHQNQGGEPGELVGYWINDEQ